LPGEGPQFVPEPIKHEPDPRAIEMWKSARPDDGTIVGRYFRNRCIDLAVPSVIRVTPDNNMIAALQAPNGKVIAIQITRLTSDCKKADVEIPRITYGSLGLGAVRLDRAWDIVGLAEGIETAFSAMQIFNIPVWACLGAARMHRVAIPASVRELYVFGDNDDPGRAAAERTAGAHRARKRVLHFPPEGYKDFNDLLKAKCGRAA
jgi:putative DNA primase/helicase